MDKSGIEVQTTEGLVRGSLDGNVSSFLGIPYAQPPIGKLRFQPPVAPKFRGGVFQANQYSLSPAQPKSPRLECETGEDCLYLNIWTSTSGEAAKPVILWIYGGGFEGGTASSDLYSGRHFAEQGDVVFISVNYRVGLLGFASLPATAHHPATSNLGIRDVIRALEWVQANVAAFGGDPNNVTVLGQSAGAFIATALAASPTAQGLYAKLALLSGGASRVVPIERALEITQKSMEALKINEADLEFVDVERLFEAQSSTISADIGVRNSSTPNALGVTNDSSMESGILTAHPMDLFSAGDRKNKPILVAVCEAEIASFRRWSPPDVFTPKSLESLVSEVSSWGIEYARALKIVNQYQNPSGVEIKDLAIVRERLLTDWIYRLPAARLVKTQALAGGDAWALEFRGPIENPMGHGDEMEALFDGLAAVSKQPVSREFSYELQQVIISFARNNEPGWPSYSPDRDVAKVLGSKSFLAEKIFGDMLELWAGVERP